MPGDPHQCRLYAGRCFALAKRARKPEARQLFREMAETWNRLAAEIEADQTLFQAISEMDFGEPHDDLPNALKLAWESTPKVNVVAHGKKTQAAKRLDTPRGESTS